MDKIGAVIVSWDFSHERDKRILLVGKKNGSNVDIINAFQGEEAIDLYERLTKRRN